jgi:hypothetical protein
VKFNSPGGVVIVGVRIGDIIREYQIATYVSKGTFCASACAIAWLGGVKRFVSYDGAVGFHGVYYADTLQPNAAGATLPEPSQAHTKQRD